MRYAQVRYTTNGWHPNYNIPVANVIREQQVLVCDDCAVRL